MIYSNFYDNIDTRRVILQNGPYSVLEYDHDVSISPERAMTAYYASLMNVRKRQLLINMDGRYGVYAQGGAMQVMMGDLEAQTGVTGAGDLFKKILGGVVTRETPIKPFYTGKGTLVLEPTFKHIMLVDIKDWPDGMVVEDGMFLACDETVDMDIVPLSTISSVVLGGEGIFHTVFSGSGIVACECAVPMDEIIRVDLEDDVLKIDGSMAMAWSPTLSFTVEKTTGTLAGSFASGEGFVNVYRGTGRVLLAPVRRNRNIKQPNDKN